MKRLVVVPIALVLVLLTAAPALANEGGGRTFIWPKHCYDTVGIYLHTWTNLLGGHIDGRLVTSDPCRNAMSSVHIYEGNLWIREGSNAPARIGHIGDQGDVAVVNGSLLVTTSDDFCHNGPPNDTVWTEWRFRVNWTNRTQTAIRDNNSGAWVPQPNEDC